MLQPPTVLPVGDLTGNDVVNVEGERLGTIASYAIDLEQGRIAYAVLSFGGFLGFGDKRFKDNWPSPDNRQFALEVYKYYGRVPYWEQEEQPKA